MPFTFSAPTSSVTVGKKSQNAVICSTVFFSFIIFGQFTINGARTPPSYKSLLYPRYGPLLSKKSGSCPPTQCTPLSEEKIKIVFSQIPFSFSNRIICPTFLSISLTMDAYAAFGFICVLKPFCLLFINGVSGKASSYWPKSG